MKVKNVQTKKDIKAFIKMPYELYKNDKYYVPFMENDLYKTLIKLIINDKTYKALLVEESGKYVGRILYTVGPSKQLNLDKCGYFSHFECINNNECAKLLFDEMINELKKDKITHIEGTFFPFDQDNRRGIQISGFNDEPMILTSYNKEYYQDLFVANGFDKDFDTIAYKHIYEEYDFNRVSKIKDRLEKMAGISIKKANFKDIDNEIKAIHSIMEQATNDIIFQEAPTLEEIHSIVNGWKSFLWDDLILIARNKENNKPVGFVMAIPNFYYVFRKMKGKINPISLIKMLYYKNKISSMRIMLQYVIPEYQNKGVNYLLYNELFVTSQSRGIHYVESGTIMENNKASRQNVEKAGGIQNKIFRIYGRNI